MWWTFSLVGLLLVGLQEPAPRPKERAATGTRAAAVTDTLPDSVVKRIRAIEAKSRPPSRAWEAAEAEALTRKQGFDQAHRSSREKAARYHNRLADGLDLSQEEKAQFLSILRSAHEARLEAVVYTLKQGSGYTRRIRALSEAGKVPEALRQADPRTTNRKLRKLLGEKRFAAYLEVREKGS